MVVNLRTYIMFHKTLDKQNYICDPAFDFDHYGFIEANPDVSASYDEEFFGDKIIREYDLPIYDPHLQKACYMAPSIIYHAYKNEFHKPMDYIGFLEYDIPLSKEGTTSVTQESHNLLGQNERLIVTYRDQHTLEKYKSQKNILLNGQNAIDQIFIDYNQYWGTHYKPESFLEYHITGQQSFIADKNSFEDIMQFVSYVIEQRLAERPDSFPRPSTLLDRYIAVAILLHQASKKHTLSLSHQNLKQWSDRKKNKAARIIKFLKNAHRKSRE